MRSDLRKTAGILVADGDDIVRDYLISSLEDAGFSVKPVKDGVEAVLAFIYEADKLDAALLEISLSSLNGLNVLKILKAIDPSFPVLMITGRVDGHKELELISLANGAIGFITKPFQSEKLLELLRNIVDR